MTSLNNFDGESITQVQSDDKIKSEIPTSPLYSDTVSVETSIDENDSSSTVTISSLKDNLKKSDSQICFQDIQQCNQLESSTQHNNELINHENKKKLKFTSKQWATFIVFAFVNVWSASCVSIQAPFFPKEAEMKGVTNTESGLVFGCFQLTVLLMSPIVGKYMNKIGPKLVFNVGITVTGFCSILFGFLTFVDDRIGFFVLAIVIRVIEAIGYTAGITATFTLVAVGFPESVATVFAFMETFNGAGLIVGPMVGVWLYHIGGFLTPFAVIGFFLLIGAVLAYFVMPQVEKDISSVSKSKDYKQQVSYFKLIIIPSVAMAAFSIFAAAVSIGFNFPTIEPHIKSLNLGVFMEGLVFITHGLTYALTAPIWGRICDKYLDPKYVTLVGAAFIFIGIALIGPTDFLPLEKSLGLILLGLCLQGFGLGATLVSGFAHTLRSALEYGYPDGIETNGLVSGLWMAMFALGNFIGPTVAGYLYDHFDGYPQASYFVLAVQFLVVTIYCLNIIGKCSTTKDAQPKSKNSDIHHSTLGDVNVGFEESESIKNQNIV